MKMAGEVNPCNFEPTDRHVFDTAEKIGENSQNPWAQISNYTQELSKQALGLTASEPEKTNTLKNWSADASAGLACGLTKHPEFENQLQLYINLLNGTPP